VAPEVAARVSCTSSPRGTNDPTGASLPLHLAANGSLAVGHDVSVVLAGDGADMARRTSREEVHGVACRTS
jgi:hypothetical protein